MSSAFKRRGFRPARILTGTGRIFAIVSFVTMIGGLCASAQESVEDFYKGRQLTMIVGNSPGGGYDAAARLVSRHMGNYIPGKPSFIVRNMPGAGGITAANYMYSVATKDGAIISIFPRNLITLPIIEKQKFESDKFAWIGSMADDVSTCVVSKASGIDGWAVLKEREFVAAVQGPGSDSFVFSGLLRDIAKLKIRLISGYPGSNDMMLAIERAEVNGMCGSSYSTLKSSKSAQLASGDLKVIVQIGPQKHAELPTTPSLVDIVEGELSKHVVKLLSDTQAAARPFIGPPDMPVDRRDALRQAFLQTMVDASFKKEAALSSLDINPMSGQQIEALISSFHAFSPQVIELARKVLDAKQ